VIACIVVAVISIGVAIYYFADTHPKRGVAFVGLAVVFGIGAWMLSRPRQRV
jgi:putative Mn2+ efflux pump MntP